MTTDLFVPTGLIPSPREAESYCPGCYLDALDSVGEALRHVVVAEVLDDEYVFGAASIRKYTERIVSVLTEVLGLDVSRHSLEELYTMAEEPGENGIPGTYYWRELARGIGSESRDIYTAVIDSSELSFPVLDFTTSLSNEVKVSLARKVAKSLHETDDYQRVNKRGDISRLVSRKVPLLGSHYFGDIVEGLLWRRLKHHDRELLGVGSRRSIQNQNTGREFELYFEDYCERKGIDYYRDSVDALRRHHPNTYRVLDRKFPGLPGIPDYYVVGDGSLSREEWCPGGEAFVEVKYRGSQLSKKQTRVIAHLKSHGFPVYVLRGTPDEHYFDRR